MSDMWEGVDTVNDSASSISKNVDYVSEREQYMVYTTKHEISRNIEAATELLEESPSYLYEEEYAFLERFVTVFKRSEHQAGFNVDNRKYLELFDASLDAIKARMTAEREKLVTEVDGEEGLEIQHMFYQIGELLSKIINELDENWPELIRGKKELGSVDEFNAVLQYLMRAYRYEHELLSEGTVDTAVVREQIVQLSGRWNQLFEGGEGSYA